MMAKQTQRPDSSAFSADDEIDRVLASANPNPDRVGCPPADVLIALARRERPISDPAHVHVVQCSPCYREFRVIQQRATTQPLGILHRRTWWVAAAAAVILAAGLAAWVAFFGMKEPSGPGRVPEAVPAAPLDVLVDLRRHTVSRSAQGQEEQPPVVLPRGLLNMTVLLPVGAEPGAYEIRLVKGDRRSQASAEGHAEIRDGITTLRVTMDLRSLSAGSHHLALRRADEGWHFYPASVK
jgi:hypothetical protein